MNRVLLINSIFTQLDGEPAGLLYIASFLRAHNIQVDIIDPSVLGENNLNTIFKNFVDEKYLAIGVSVLESTEETLNNVTLLVKYLKEKFKNTYIWVGGIGASLRSLDYLNIDGINSVCIGEGELTILELVQNLLANKNDKNINGLMLKGNKDFKKRELIKNLSTLPFMARDTIEERIKHYGREKIKNFQFRVYGGRGCFGNCSYCANMAALNFCEGAKYRQRDISDLVKEIEIVNKTYGATRFIIWDDNFLPKGKNGKIKAQRLHDELKKYNLNINFGIQTRPDTIEEDVFKILKNCGLTHLFLGVENFADDDLKILKKGISEVIAVESMEKLRNVGFECNPSSTFRLRTGCIIFNPYTTLESFHKNLKQFIEYNIPIRKIGQKVLAFHGVELREKIKKDNLLRGEFDWEFKNELMTIFYNEFEKSLKILVEIFEKMRDIEKSIIYLKLDLNMLKVKLLREELENFYKKLLLESIENLLKKFNQKEIIKAMTNLNSEVYSYIKEKDIHKLLNEYEKNPLIKNEKLDGIGFL